MSLWLGFEFSLQAADWPQWLGPNRDGASAEVVAPWTEPPKVVWRVKVAEGHASPVVAGGRIILHTAANDTLGDSDEQRGLLEYVTAYSAKTGKVEWVARLDKKPFKSQFGNGPRATPAVADGRVHCFGVTGNAAILDLATGKLLADQFDLIAEYKAKVPVFGVSAAPLVEAGKVYFQVGGSEGGVVALDATTGKYAAKSLSGAASYAAMIAVGTGDQRQVIVLNADGLYGLPPGGGEPFWIYPFKDMLSESSTTPIVARDKLIISSITRGTVALKMIEKHGKPAVEEAWKNPQLSCYFSTPVPVGKHLYLVAGNLLPPQKADLHCIDLETGKSLWHRPKVGTYGATLIRTGDDKLLMLEESGDLVLIQPDEQEYKELSRAKVCGNTWAHPALADGKLYVRDREELKCVEVGK